MNQKTPQPMIKKNDPAKPGADNQHLDAVASADADANGISSEQSEADLLNLVEGQFDSRFAELAEYNEEELKYFVMFLENRMSVLMIELELGNVLEQKKAELMDKETAGEDVSEEFDRIQEEVDMQMYAGGAFIKSFDDCFSKKAPQKLVDLLISRDDEEGGEGDI